MTRFLVAGGSLAALMVRTAVAANILFLAFFALESSDRLVRQGGNFVYWSTYLFLAFVAMSPFAKLQSHGVPVPWYGRIYVAAVSLVFAATLAGTFWSLGRSDTRNYFTPR